MPVICCFHLKKINIKSLSEKPNNQYFINAGIYIFDPELIKLVPKNQFYDMTTFIDSLIQLNKKVIAYKSIEYWLDIGKKDDFKKANKTLKWKPTINFNQLVKEMVKEDLKFFK